MVLSSQEYAIGRLYTIIYLLCLTIAFNTYICKLLYKNHPYFCHVMRLIEEYLAAGRDALGGAE